MGNDVSVTEKETPEAQGDCKWPENLYVETWDMAAVVFLVHTFGHVLGAVGEESPDTDEGKTNESQKLLNQNEFSASDVKQLIEENLPCLKEKYPGTFDEEVCATMTNNCLDKLVEHSAKSKDNRGLTLEAYSYDYEKNEIIYGICKDSVNKNITIVFGGAENKSGGRSKWLTNTQITKQAFTPPSLEGKIGGPQVWFHKGFYDYLFDKTHNPKDEDMPNYYSILVRLKSLVKNYPDHKIYTTGHGLGAALSTIAGFFFAATTDLPKPITCINFGSPRVGDLRFLEAVQVLEKEESFRLLRLVNENDAITAIPSVNYYHAGFQVMMYEGNHEPHLTYPKIIDSYRNRFSRAYENSFFNNWNLMYDRGEYRERVEKDKDALQKYDFDKLYENEEMTGFSLKSAEEL